MCVAFRSRKGRGGIRCLFLSVVTALLASGGAAWAANVTVYCPSSINYELGLLDTSVPNTVTIHGTCVEAVVIAGFKDLSLDGDAVIQPPGAASWPGYSALTVSDSRLSVSGLSFDDPRPDINGPPVVSIERSKVTLWGCAVRGGRSNGLEIGGHSLVDIADSTIENNANTGLLARGSSTVNLSTYVGLDDFVIIQGNRVGVGASDGAYVVLGNVTIQDNLENAVSASSSGIVDFGSWMPEEPGPEILHNGAAASPWIPAVVASLGGEVWLGEALIHDNRAGGVSAEAGGRVMVCCGQGQVTIRDNYGAGLSAWSGGAIMGWITALVEGNRLGGVSVGHGSKAEFYGNTSIRRNGDSTDPDSHGGFFVDNGSSLVLGDVTVAENYGPGVFLRGNSSVDLGENVSIADNQGYGFLLELGSTAVFGDTVSASGNRKFDLVCASGSVAGTPKGSHPAIGKMQCSQWYQLQPLPE